MRLLEHLIRAEVAEQGGTLKAYALGLDVFDKSETFDPTSDSSVRVEIRRLRTAIALFEASDYAETDLRVAIPIGTYRPTLTLRIIKVPEPQKQAPKTVSAAISNRNLLGLLAVVVIAVLLLGTYWRLDDRGTVPDKAAIN